MNDPRSTDPNAPARRPAAGPDDAQGRRPEAPGDGLSGAGAHDDGLQPPDFRPEPTAAPAQPVRPANLDFGFDSGAFERALGEGGRPVPPPVVRPRLPPRPAAQGQSLRTPVPPRPPVTPAAPGAGAAVRPPVRPAAPRPAMPVRPAAGAAPVAPAAPHRPAAPPPVPDLPDDLEEALASEIRGTVPPHREPVHREPPQPDEGPKAAMAPVSRGPAARVLGTLSDDDGAGGIAPPFEPLPPIERAASRRAGPVRPTVIDTPPVPQIEEPPFAVPDPMQQDFSQDFDLSPFDLAGANAGATRPRKPEPAPAPASARLPEAGDFDDDQAYEAAFENAIAGWRDETGRPASAESLDEAVDDHNFTDLPDEPPPFLSAGEEDMRPQRRRRSPVLWIGATVLIVILIGLAGYYTTEFFGGGLSDEPPPVIRAEDGPVKVEPPPSTAAETSDPSKVFYDRVAETNKAENQTLDQPGATAEGVAQQARPGDSELPGVANGQPQPQQQAAAGTPQPVVPRKVRTVVVRPDGTIITPDPDQAAEAAADAEAQARAAARPQVPALSPQQTQTAEDPLASMNYITPGKFVMPKPRPDNSRAELVAPDGGAPPGEVRQAALSPPADTAAPTTEQAGNAAGAAVSPPFAVAEGGEMPTFISSAVPAGPAGHASGLEAAEGTPARQTGTPAVPPAPAQVAAAAADTAPAPDGETVAAGGEATAPAPEAGVAVSQEPAPEATAPVTNDVVPSAAASDAADTPFGVQLASQKSRAEAEKAFAALKRRFPALLGEARPVIVSARVGDRGTFYRVRVGAPSAAAAASLCSRLKAAGGSCFVVRG